MNGLRTWLIAGLAGLALVFTASCQSGGGGGGSSQDGAPVAFDMDFAYLLQQVSGGGGGLLGFTADDVLTGELVATPSGGGDPQVFQWSVYVDETTLDAQSNKTIVLHPGDYDFDLTVTRGDHTYHGEALMVPIVDGENTVALTLAPVIGLTTTNVLVVERLVDLRFQYNPTELSVLVNPEIGIVVDGGVEQIFEVNPVTGLSAHMHLDLPPGPHTIQLRLYSEGTQRGKSLVAQETQNLQPGVNVTMDLVALHGEVQFELDVASGDAQFDFLVPAEVVDEAGGVGDLLAHLTLTSDETGLLFERDLSLSQQPGGDYAATENLSGFQFEAVTIALSFSDITDSELLGSCVHVVTLSTDDQSSSCDLVLRRRAVIGGNLLATLGVNVFSTEWEPVMGATVRVDGEIVGITGEVGVFGTPGYLKLFLVAGEHTIRASAGGLAGQAVVSLSPLGIGNVDIQLTEDDLAQFNGVQNDVLISELNGWEQCFLGDYNSVDGTVADVLAACPKANLMLACRPPGSSILRVAAHAPRPDVTFDTGSGNENSTPHVANGVGWYFNDSWSWGFAPEGEAIFRNSCDLADSFNPNGPLGGSPNQRICWHTSGGNLAQGWRCGSEKAVYNPAWERLIYQAD